MAEKVRLSAGSVAQVIRFRPVVENGEIQFIELVMISTICG